MSQLLFILAIAASTFSKADFFYVLSNGTLIEIEALEKKVSSSKQDLTQQAYLGTVQMKLSEFGKTPGEKLKQFKVGKNLLETSIQTDPNNVELRFLRIIIQENAPKMLKYNSEISEDAAFIKKNYDKLTKEVKTAVTNYSKKSTHLKI